MRFSSLVTSLTFVLVACGPAAPPAAEPAANASSAASALPTTALYSTMTKEQKIDHMKTVVTPAMKKVFQEHNAQKYSDFGCKTCHGDKKQDPRMFLPALTLSGDGFEKLMTSKPEMTKFMREQVTPAMAAVMKEKPYDPVTHKGYGCSGCHKVD
ncbi:MAG: hypothetical protein FWD73_03235 [Polyangiaceae bacterium]|nr:hypothetical protein [Polyangiaceae bacterium]